MARKTIVLPTNSTQSFNRGISSPVPAPPNLTSVTPGNEQNTLIWTPVVGATDYHIFYSTSPNVDTNSSKVEVGSPATQFIHTALVNGLTYYYKVLAVGAWGVTPLSNELSGVAGATISTKSALLNGLNAEIVFGDNHNYENSIAWSFSAWVRPNNNAASHCIWAKASNDVSVTGWIIWINSSGQLVIQARAQGQNTITTSTTTIPAQEWTHVAFTYAGGQSATGLKMYINGVYEKSGTGGLSNSMIVSEPSKIGVRNTAQRYSGHVDDVSFWLTELSADDITEIYNDGKPGNLFLHTETEHLQHWYRLGDGDTLPTFNDSKGSVHGTAVNMIPSDIDSEAP